LAGRQQSSCPKPKRNTRIPRGEREGTVPDEEEAVKAGQTMWGKAGAHLPENVGKGPIDLVLVELKGKPAEKK